MGTYFDLRNYLAILRYGGLKLD
ncbi:hypothetical protein CCACVL1_06049 [Corchorus capsularis]|uniref:Uncharacterized protein n=1 Tax=Corchorus capsularis TaxID=210143 RepID=A0A1R3JHQ5_COCAP|nr:hypothetical protein CCACVL1_06049 [Corchorus capsularis]